MYDLTDKVAIVTGAGGEKGIGRAIAMKLASEGVNVAVVDRTTNPYINDKAETWDGINSVKKEIEAMGRKSLALTCDISDSAQVDAMVKDVVEGLGKVDILVNNAGYHAYEFIAEATDQVWNQHLAVNLTGAFYCSRAVVRDMRKRNNGGRIINIASLMGKIGMGDGQTAYTSSKFGIIGLTQSMALELASYGILVNAVCPALTNTDIHKDAFEEQARKENVTAQEIRARMHDTVETRVPLGRLGKPEDIANMVAFLSSDESSFITGQSINVNGGIFTAH